MPVAIDAAGFRVFAPRRLTPGGQRVSLMFVKLSKRLHADPGSVQGALRPDPAEDPPAAQARIEDGGRAVAALRDDERVPLAPLQRAQGGRPGALRAAWPADRLLPQHHRLRGRGGAPRRIVRAAGPERRQAMKAGRAMVATWALVVASFVLAVASYSGMPDPVPTHWNLRGEADGFTPKPWGPFTMPLVLFGICGLLVVLPRLSPKGFGMEGFRRAFDRIVLGVASFFFALHVLAVLAACGASIPIGRAVFILVGALFVVLGNFMGKLTRNFFVGVRTPWTLASEEVWLRTHRLAGRTFVLAGIAVVATALFNVAAFVEFGMLALAAAIPVLYSMSCTGVSRDSTAAVLVSRATGRVSGRAGKCSRDRSARRERSGSCPVRSRQPIANRAPSRSRRTCPTSRSPRRHPNCTAHRRPRSRKPCQRGSHRTGSRIAAAASPATVPAPDCRLRCGTPKAHRRSPRQGCRRGGTGESGNPRSALAR